MSILILSKFYCDVPYKVVKYIYKKYLWWKHKKGGSYVNPTLLGTIYLILYFAIAASTALVCHYLFPIPKELFRKILHFILLGSFLVFIFAYPSWQSAALAAIIFEVLVYPILALQRLFRTYYWTQTRWTKSQSYVGVYHVCHCSCHLLGIFWR